jgi:cytoplasmic iron level regulating protein YaaA (DUF328/UPF0246 family)
MLAVISPAKTLDYETPPKTKVHTQPDFLDDAEVLIEELRELTPPKVSELMKISDKLGDLNYGRYLSWSQPFDVDNAKQAVLAFKGDVYTGLDAESFKSDEFKFLQKHVRILSGLYGLLRPLDLMQPYRLDMGTKFANSRGANLYDFWGSKLTDELNNLTRKNKSPYLVNLASNEYFKAVKKKELNADILTPVFKDYKNGDYKIISFFAKKARGLMVQYIVKNKITDVDDLRNFDLEGYGFDAKRSSEKEFVFTRKQV